jgi:tryptophan synthase alpha chain
VIFLVSPTTDSERIKLIADKASGYLYYVSLKGVTGANTLDVDSVASKLNEIRAITDLPIGVGFGIKDGPTAQAVSAIADAVVVGSVLVKQIEQAQDQPQVIKNGITKILNEMRMMMDANNRSVE